MATVWPTRRRAAEALPASLVRVALAATAEHAGHARARSRRRAPVPVARPPSGGRGAETRGWVFLVWNLPGIFDTIAAWPVRHKAG